MNQLVDDLCFPVVDIFLHCSIGGRIPTKVGGSNTRSAGLHALELQAFPFDRQVFKVKLSPGLRFEVGSPSPSPPGDGPWTEVRCRRGCAISSRGSPPPGSPRLRAPIRSFLLPGLGFNSFIRNASLFRFCDLLLPMRKVIRRNET